jgi:hypothetical protein
MINEPDACPTNLEHEETLDYCSSPVTTFKGRFRESSSKFTNDSKETKSTISTKELQESPFKKRRKQNSYKINPQSIPRPSYYEEIYKNENKGYDYLTSESPKDTAPFSTSYFICTETANSSIRLIRPSYGILPTKQETLNKINMPFGFNIQPFAQQIEGESEIPNLESNFNLFNSLYSK